MFTLSANQMASFVLVFSVASLLRADTVVLKNGDKLVVQFGGQSPSGLPYATVTLDGNPWIFEFPPLLYRDVTNYLSP